MKNKTYRVGTTILLCLLSSFSFSQTLDSSHILCSKGLELLMERPVPLTGYFSNQRGPLTRFLEDSTEVTDSTFTVDKIRVPSEGLMITGWLYLPLGNEKCPLVVLTNGGGDGSRAVKSLSDWIAPILAHCGYAAFVHDKRGTGESEGVFRETTYESYITDAGNCAVYLSKHPRIDPEKIGVLGGSEGGRVAVMAAARFPEIKFVISYAGTVVTGYEDRMYAQTGWLKTLGLADTALAEIVTTWEHSIKAWELNDPAEHAQVDIEINEMRAKYDSNYLPYTKSEMESIAYFDLILPTWNSIGIDYMSEMEHFNKKWLALFGEVDQVVPTEASVVNIVNYMQLSGNSHYTVGVIPQCGHAPVNVETRRLVHIDHMIINWLDRELRDSLHTTYIGNEGFLLEAGGKKVLVDALFGQISGDWCQQPGEPLLRKMIKGEAPFNDVDVVFVSHRHSDHFNDSIMMEYLRKNKDVMLVCPKQVDSILRKHKYYESISDRIRVAYYPDKNDTTMICNGIRFRTLKMRHGSWLEEDSTGKQVDIHQDVQNVGYLIALGGYHVLHSGDASSKLPSVFSEYGLSAEPLDVAFLDRSFMGKEGIQILNDDIHTRRIVFMHVEPAKTSHYASVIKDISIFYVFQNLLETMVFH